MYWQKRFDRENPDIELEEKIHEIHKCNKDYGYRRMCGELRNQGHVVNKKKVQRIMQKYNLQVMSFTRKSRKYSFYKGRIGTVAPNRIKRRFNTHIPHQKITTDTTEFKYYEVDSKGKMTMHKLYLDPFMDMSLVEKESYEYYKNALETGEHIAYLVYDNETFIGAGGVSFYQVMPTYHNPTGKKAYIMNMYTAPAYRRQGIAFHTLDLLVKVIRKQGVSQITLEATEMGRPLYEKYGFVKMEDAMELIK